MKNSSIPPEWYPQQAKLAAMELDFDLHMAAWEAEIRSAIAANFQPMPVADPPPPENSVYNFNAILDSLPAKPGTTSDDLLNTLEYPERDIVEIGLKQSGDWVAAWKCHNLNRSLRNISLEDIRLIFQGLADRGIEEVEGEGDKTRWRIDQTHLDKL